MSARLESRPTALVAVAAVAMAAATAQAQFSLDCERVAGIRSIRVAAPEGVDLTAEDLGGGRLVVHVASPDLPGIPSGEADCAVVVGVRVLPGTVLGAGESRILVRHDGQEPRITSGPGRLRLTWLPPASAPPEAVPAARDWPVRGDVAAETAARAEPWPPRAAPAPSRALPVAQGPAGVRVSRGGREPDRPAHEVLVGGSAEPPPRGVLPPNFIALETPERLVAVIPADVREGPGQRFRSRSRIAAGESVVVDGLAGDWYRAGAQGWVFAPYLEGPEEAGEDTPSTWEVTVDAAPLHAGPGGQHEIVGEVHRGEQVRVDDDQAEWLHAEDGGWLRRDALARVPRP